MVNFCMSLNDEVSLIKQKVSETILHVKNNLINMVGIHTKHLSFYDLVFCVSISGNVILWS